MRRARCVLVEAVLLVLGLMDLIVIGYLVMRMVGE